jgi:hypothetical protein
MRLCTWTVKCGIRLVSFVIENFLKMAKGNPHPKPRVPRPNATVDLRSMALASLEELGGQSYLVSIGNSDPKAYLSFLGKFAPREVKAELTGADGRPLRIEHIEYTIVDPLAVSSLS